MLMPLKSGIVVPELAAVLTASAVTAGRARDGVPCDSLALGSAAGAVVLPTPDTLR